MPPEPASRVSPSMAARTAVAATVFAVVLAYGLLAPPDPSAGVALSAALLALVAQWGFVAWYERLATRQELQPFSRVVAFSIATGTGFVLYVALREGEVPRGVVVLGAVFVIVGLALGLADRRVWLHRHQPTTKRAPHRN